jgi:hypothetical protein
MNISQIEADPFADDDDEDEMLGRALEASMAQFNQEQTNRVQTSAPRSR